MIRNICKHYLALLLAAAMLVGLLPINALAEGTGKETSGYTRASSLNTGVAGLTAEYDNGTWSANSTQHSINGSVKTTSSTSCGSTTYKPQTGTLTLTNSSGAKATLSFSATVTLDGGSALINGEDAVTRVYSFILEKNQTTTITIKSSDSAVKTTSIMLENIALTSEKNVTVTFTPAEHGSYTVDGTPVTQNTVITKKSTETFSVSATADSGYVFSGWISGDDSSNVIGSEASMTLNFTEDATVTAFFIDDSVAVFDVAGRQFYNLNSAISYAQNNSKNKVTLVSDGILPAGNYTIPNGITLLIPYDSAYTLVKDTPTVVYGDSTNPSHFTPTAYKILTMANGASITVENGGAISCAGKLCTQGQMGGWNGTPTGPDGRIYMHSGSSITLENGANLYCWGYIYGSGEVEAKSGSTVYEAFQIKDWRGGSATSNVYDYVFIFNQYYVQNVETALKVNAGASVKLYSSVNASSRAYPIGATLIGTGGMFRISSGYIVKDYNESKDQLDVAVYGNVSMNPLVISGVPMVGDVSTENYRLPLNNMNIDIRSLGKITLEQDLEFLPGSEVTVARGAEFEVSSGKKAYLFDVDDWGNFTGSAKLYAVGYSVANGTAAIRTAANLRDARIDVNGKVTVEGSLFTSEHGADITSTEGYDEGYDNDNNGKFVFNTAPTASATIYECANNKDKTSVSFYAPKLHNGDGSYSETVSTGTSTWKYDKSGEHWYRFLVDFVYNELTVARDYYCENNDTVTYDASWLENLNATASNGSANVSGTTVEVTGVTADCTVTLGGTPEEFIPTFVLNEKQYSIYRLYTGNTIEEMTVIGEDTYYIVDQASSALAVGTAYSEPSDADMGVAPENHNSIIWNMSGLSYTSGDPYRGTVPAGEAADGPVYIYGFYAGAVAHNSYTNEYYSTLIDAFADIPADATAVITLLADCGTFEEELGTQAYTCYKDNDITLDLNGHHAVGRIINQGTFTLELNGGTLEYKTGATAAAAAYAGMAAVINSGTMTIQDSVGGGEITSDAISNSSTNTSYSSAVRNNPGATLTITGGTIRTTETVNGYSANILNLSGATIDLISGGTFNPAKGCGLYNLGTVNSISGGTFTTSGSSAIYNGATGRITSLANATLSSTTYCVNNTSGTIDTIDNCNMSTANATVLYNYNGAKITTLKNTSLTITAPTTKNIYVLNNYGGTITTIDNCTITGNSGINNRNQRNSTAITAGYVLANRGTIGTISNSTVSVGQYAIYNGGTINTLSNSTFTAAPASAQVPWPSGTAALNGNVHCYTIVNSNLWWYDTAVWKRTDTNVDNNGTTMLQRRIDEYKTGDEFMPTIGTITDCTIEALNTSNSNSYGYFALQNLGVINTITGSTTITAKKHPDNAKTVYGYYALRNESGGKIGNIASSVTVSAYNYALANIGARYSRTDTSYSTTYLVDGKLKSGGLATDYDYTYADVSYIGSTAATITATSQYAILNYSKIGSITGTVSANYNVIVNAGAANTTTGIEGTTANVSAIEHRYFEGNDSSTTANEYRRYFEYTRNTTDGCYIGTINATVTATGAGYQAITNQGYIGTITGTVNTPTGKATSGSTYYPLIFNGNQRQATLKQDEYYYIETNDAGATKYLREYTYLAPTIDTISCTATNPQDYTIQNYGVINNLTGNISGKTITVANETGYYLTRKSIIFYSSTSRFAASKGSSEVSYEYTKEQATIGNINGAEIKAANGATALRNYGHIGIVQGSTITSTGASTVINSNAGLTVTNYTSNRSDVLVGCVPNGTASCALRYDTTQTINENETCAIALIDLIGAGNTIRGTNNVIDNKGKISAIDSDSDDLTTIIATGGIAVNNYQGGYNSRINTDAELTDSTGTLTNHYTYNYVPAEIGMIKNVYIQSTQNAIKNGEGNANYVPVRIGEIGDGAEFKSGNGYSAVYNYSSNAQIEKITGGIFTSGTGNAYGLYNGSTTYPILISGGHFKGGDATRNKAILDPDNTNRQTYPEGMSLSADTEDVTLHDGTTGSDYYYIWKVITVTFNANDGVGTMDQQTVGAGKEFTLNTNTFTRDGYEFSGWNTAADGSGTAYGDGAEITLNVDTTLYAQWTEVAVTTYTVTWKNYDGTVLETDENVEAGTIPSYNGPTPTKEATAEFTYTFAGWTPEVVAVTDDAVYTATFTERKRSYTVTWKNADGTVLETDADVPYGTVPSYDGATPTKEATAEFTYTFDGWTREGDDTVYTAETLPAVTGDVTYTAHFRAVLRRYTVTVHHYLRGTTDSVAADVSSVQAYGTQYAAQAVSAFYSDFDGCVISVSGTLPTAEVTGDTELTVYYVLAVTITAASDEWEYDGSAHGNSAVTVTAGALRNGDTLNASANGSVTDVADTAAGNNPVAAGYGIKRNGESVGYYVISTAAGTLTITPKAVTVAAVDNGKTYGETDPALTAEVTGLIGDDTVAYMLSRAEGEAVGEYAITASGAAAQGNYAVTYVPGVFNITRATAIVTADDKTWAYHGENDEPELTATVTGLVNGDSEDVISYTVDREPGNAPGTYVITPGGSPVQGNYNVTYRTGTLTIVLAEYTVTVHHYLNGTTDKIANDETVTVAYGATYTAQAAEGFIEGFSGCVAEVCGTLPSAQITGNTELTVYYKLAITITAANGEWVYDGSSHTAETVSVTAGALRNGDALDAHASGSVTNVSDTQNGNNPVAAGYGIKRNGESVGYYVISTAAGTLTITPKAVTVAAVDNGKTYGETDPALTAEVTGLIGGDTVEYTLSRAEGEAVGEYAITANGPTDQGNYAVTYVPGVFNITRATAIVTADDKTWTYHGENDEPELTATVTGLKNGDSANVITYTLTREPGTEAGRYTITASGDAIQGNYNVTYRTGTLTIVLAEYTVTWKNWNGVILEIDENVPYGTIPRYNGQIPEKEETEQCTYSFMGWSPIVTAITGDTEYVAVFCPEPKTYTVTWMNEGAAIEVDVSVPYGNTPQYNGETPVKQGDAQYTYTFIGWNDGTETYLTGQTLPPVHGDTVFTAVYSTDTNKYTVEWIVNGETVETDTNVPYGTMPEYNGAPPEKEGNAQYSYRFTGWDPEVTVVTGNAVYTAVFEEILNTYTVTWIGHDGQVLETDEGVPYGTIPAYNGNTPQKPSTPQYSYSFEGWTPEVVPVTGNAEYTAVFTENTRTYTVTWKNWNGDVLETDAEVPYGDMPEYNGQTPERVPNAQFSYIFNGWEPDLAEVTDNAVYIASFLFVTNTYTVTWKDWNGEVLAAVSGIPYGDMPVYSGPDPARPADAQYTYVFTGWYPTVVSVTGDAVYTAQYGTIVNRYTISFIGYNNAEVASYTVDYGTAVSVPAAPEVEGHTFVEWKSGDTVYPTGSTITAVEDLTIQAEYSVNTYTVTYKVNGIAVEYLTVRYGDPIPASSFVAPEGCRLGEWGEIPETMPAHDVTVEAEMTTTITYEANGGEGDAVDRTVLWMVEDVLENALFEREGFTFAGWNTEADGSGSAYGGGAAVTPAGPMTLYAQWSERTFTITWNNYDGSKLGETVVAYGAIPVYEGEDPAKPGNEQYTYSFMGWTPAVVPAHEDTTYTAVFSASVNTYEIRFVNYNGALLASYQVPYGEIPVYSGQIPEMPSTDEFSYSFAGWEPAIVSVTCDAVYRAVFTTATNTYTVTWYNWDGTELEKDENVAYGTLPTYDGELPKRAADAQYTYEFAGWTPAVSAVTGNTAYTAVYSTTVNEYTVRFLDYDGEELAEYTLAYGTTPEYNGPAPERAATAQYTYSFAGWSPEISEVTGNVDYTAVYSSTVNTYSVVFLNDDGSLLEALTLEYGTLPSYAGETPQKASTAQYSYTFTGWTPEITEVTGDTVYTAVYSAAVNSYPITWYGWNGEVIDTTMVEYGTLPAYDAPERPADAQYTYTFIGWSPELTEVTGAAAYTATYIATVNTYTVTWVNWNGTVLKTDAGVPYGTLPAYTGETPVRPSDNENVYTFTGWTPEIAEVEGDVTYTAAYSAEDRFYDLYVTVNLTAPVTESRTFVFRVLNENETVQLLFPITVRSGSQAATTCIHGMKYGTYTVTELTGWSWEYGLTDDSTASRTVVIHSASDSYTAVFGNRPHVLPWLRSEQTRLFD